MIDKYSQVEHNIHEIKALRSEARTLRYLLRHYIDDQSFSLGMNPGMFIYVVDSHELKSYIDLDKDEYIKGFILEAEHAQYHGNKRFFLDIKLKNKQILEHLLFQKNANPIGLLPSHAEEVDEEITYHQYNYMKSRISLLDQARDQVNRLRTQQLPSQLIKSSDLKIDSICEDNKTKIVKFFQAVAPALMALLRPSPSDPNTRVRALIEKSNLNPFNEIRWEAFGIEPHKANQLRNYMPNRNSVNKWHEFLSNCDYRQKNSNRANRIDAEAMACVEDLNDQLSKITEPRIRVQLVTRAMTLINASRDWHSQNNARPKKPDFLRHPRLLFLAGKRETPEAEAAAAQSLVVALKTYQLQLKDQEIGADEELLKSSLNSLVEAWHKFETARFTFELLDNDQSSRDNLHMADESIADHKFQELLAWFRSDEGVEKLIADDLCRSVQDFGTATYRLSQSPSFQPIQGIIIKKYEPPRRAGVFPVLTCISGPVEFRAKDVLETELRYPNLDELLGNLDSSACERYLAWALLHACHERWELAEIYAKSSIQMARLPFKGSDGLEAAADEARLLLVQVRRLRGLTQLDDSKRAKEAIERYEEIDKHLKDLRSPKDVRLLRERAAHIIELLLELKVVQSTQGMKTPKTANFEYGIEVVKEGIKASNYDNQLHVQVLEIGLTFALYVLDFSGECPPALTDFFDLVRLWHDKLHNILDDQRKKLHIDEISILARALELVGFQLPELIDKQTTSQSVQPYKPYRHPRVPLHLRLDARELMEQIERRSNKLALIIAKELSKVVEPLDITRQRDLVLAPVWPLNDTSSIIGLISNAKARSLAETGYDVLSMLAGPEEECPVDAEDRSKLEKVIGNLSAALNIISTEPESTERKKALFFLRMELCYTRLLLSQISTNDSDDCSRQLNELIEEYSSIAAEYPDTAIPHFRLNVIYSDLNQSDAAMREANLAADLIDRDPFLQGSNHWVRSTIHRRVAWNIAKDLLNIRDKLRSQPEDVAFRERYVSTLQDAFGTIYGDFSPPSEEKVYLFKLEASRRTNNIVFYAALIHEATGSFSKLGVPDFDANKMEKLTEELHPRGIDGVEEASVVHTIGYAYHVLGNADKAYQAGKRLIELIIKRGDDPHKREVAELLQDAFDWYRRGDDSITAIDS